MKKKVTLISLVVIMLVLAACASPAPMVIEKEVPVEREVVKTVVVEKEIPVEVPVTVEIPVEVTREIVVTTTPITPIYPEINLEEVKLEENELIFSWDWGFSEDFTELKGAKFCSWIWKQDERLPTEYWCTKQYFKSWGNPYYNFTPGETYNWQIELRWGDKILTASPVGEFVLPTPTPSP